MRHFPHSVHLLVPSHSGYILPIYTNLGSRMASVSSHPRSATPQGRVRGPPPQLAGHQLRCPDATPMVGRETSRDTTDCLDQHNSRSVSSDPSHTTLGGLFRRTAPKDDIGALNESPSPDSVGERATPVGTPSAGWPAGPPPMEVSNEFGLTVAAIRSSAVNSQQDASIAQQLCKSTELGRTPDKAMGVQESAQNLGVPPLPLLAAAKQPSAPVHLPQPAAATGKPDNSTHASPSPGNGACRGGSLDFLTPVEPPVGTPPDVTLASPITDDAAYRRAIRESRDRCWDNLSFAFLSEPFRTAFAGAPPLASPAIAPSPAVPPPGLEPAVSRDTCLSPGDAAVPAAAATLDVVHDAALGSTSARTTSSSPSSPAPLLAPSPAVPPPGLEPAVSRDTCLSPGDAAVAVASSRLHGTPTIDSEGVCHDTRPCERRRRSRRTPRTWGLHKRGNLGTNQVADSAAAGAAAADCSPDTLGGTSTADSSTTNVTSAPPPHLSAVSLETVPGLHPIATLASPPTADGDAAVPAAAATLDVEHDAALGSTSARTTSSSPSSPAPLLAPSPAVPPPGLDSAVSRDLHASPGDAAVAVASSRLHGTPTIDSEGVCHDTRPCERRRRSRRTPRTWGLHKRGNPRTGQLLAADNAAAGAAAAEPSLHLISTLASPPTADGATAETAAAATSPPRRRDALHHRFAHVFCLNTLRPELL